MITLRSLALLLPTFFITFSCSETSDTEKRTDGTTVNPYSGVTSESTPSEISGAWLVRCDIESLGNAVANEKDSVYCRTNDESGKKSPREISFLDSAMAKFKDFIKEAQPDDSVYTVKYQFPAETIKSYNDLLSPDKAADLNYKVIDKSKFNWSAITDPVSAEQIQELLTTYGSKINEIDEIFCDANGALKSDFLIASGLGSLSRSTAVVAESNSCFVSTDVLSDISKLKEIFTDKLISGAKATGCRVAILHNSVSLDGKFRFAILNKERVASSFKSPNDVTLPRLNSAAYAGQCGFPSGIAAKVKAAK